MAKSEHIVFRKQIIWLNGVDENTRNEALDLLVELLLEQRSKQISALIGSSQLGKVEAA